jgi:prevent-host-death family protein
MFMRQVSLREASRGLGRCIRAVESGSTIEITRRGTAVARIVPAPRRSTARPARGLNRLIALMAKAPALGIRRWSRDDIYERGQ